MTEPNASRAALSDHSAGGEGEPTGHQIRTDRPCARCGFNLFGQTIVREPHYGLVAARCPECGQLAALQEYPALGKWADRWAKLIAAAWVVALLGAAAAQFAPTFGMLIASVEIASENFAEVIAAEFNRWEIETRNGVTTNGQNAFGGWSMVDRVWWSEHADRVLASRGGVFGAIDQRAGWVLGPLCLVSFAAGMFWSVCLLGARRWMAIVPALIPLALAATIVWLVQGVALLGGTMTYAHDLATATFRNPVLVVGGGAAVLCVLLGVWQGRRLARVLVRLSLPPRMRSALAILWTRDGLPAPSARGD